MVKACDSVVLRNVAGESVFMYNLMMRIILVQIVVLCLLSRGEGSWI